MAKEYLFFTFFSLTAYSAIKLEVVWPRYGRTSED